MFTKAEALRDAALHLIAAASAYREYAVRSDPFYQTRVADFERASDRARAALAASDARESLTEKWARDCADDALLARQEAENLRDRLSALEAENARLKEEHRSLSEEAAHLRRCYVKHSDENAFLRARLAQAEKERDEAREERDAARETRADALQKALEQRAAAEAEAAQLREQVEETRAELRALEDAVARFADKHTADAIWHELRLGGDHTARAVEGASTGGHNA